MSTSVSFSLLSHPNYTLKSHLSGVYEKGMDIFERNCVFIGDRTLMRLILLFHDLGKASSYFQEYIEDREKPYSDLKNHAEISALWFFYYAKKVIKLPLKKCYLGFVCIKKHHGDIENFRDNANSVLREKLLTINDRIDYDELNKIYKPNFDPSAITKDNFIEFYKHAPRISRITRKLQKELDSQDYLRLNYLFSILLSADKGDAIWKKEFEQINSISIPKDVVDKFKIKFPLNNDVITKIRNRSYKEVEENIRNEENIFSVNLPTGSGKTLSLLNVALKMRNSEQQRIIYCLPFTSIIDQNMEVFEEVLNFNNIKVTSDIILKHHHLSEAKYLPDKEEDYDANKSEYLIESWESKIVVTTFYQLLLTIFSNKNRMLKKFHSLTNSIVILDEVQTIPIKYWELISKIFKHVSTLMNVKIILGTATMPLIFDEQENEIFELAKSKKEYFKSLNRISIDCCFFREEMSIAQLSELILEHQHSDPAKSRLIIVNTVKASLYLYSKLKEQVDEENLIYLSTNVIPIERKRRIEYIRENSKGKIIISTQLVEAGVDIDIDVVYRDFAPLDSIFQACGRCNRNDSKFRGKVFLLNLINEHGRRFRNFIYDKMLLSQTEKCFIDKEIIEESDFIDLSNSYFQNVKIKKSEDNSRKLMEEISTLNYENAFSYPQNKDAFHLIDELKVVSAFIEVDEASEILQEYKSVVDLEFEDSFKRRIFLKGLMKRMSPFIISVPVKSADQKEGLWIIGKEEIFSKYDYKTGFKREPEIKDFIF